MTSVYSIFSISSRPVNLDLPYCSDNCGTLPYCPSEQKVALTRDTAVTLVHQINVRRDTKIKQQNYRSRGFIIVT